MIINKFELYSKLPTKRRESMPAERKKFILFYLNDFLRDYNPGYFELMDYLVNKKLHPNTKSTLAHELGKFFNWAQIISTEEFRLIKNSFHPVQHNFSAKNVDFDIKKFIILALENNDNFIKVRNSLIFVMFGTVGMRVSQLAELDVKDITINDYIVIKLNRKKGAIGIDTKRFSLDAGIGEFKLKDMLQTYFKYHKSGKLLVTKDGKPISTTYLMKIVKRYAKQLNLNISSHYFRHKVCTEVANKYGILKAQLLLGHRDIKTTLKYIDTNQIEVF